MRAVDCLMQPMACGPDQLSPDKCVRFVVHGTPVLHPPHWHTVRGRVTRASMPLHLTPCARAARWKLCRAVVPSCQAHASWCGVVGANRHRGWGRHATHPLLVFLTSLSLSTSHTHRARISACSSARNPRRYGNRPRLKGFDSSFSMSGKTFEASSGFSTLSR